MLRTAVLLTIDNLYFSVRNKYRGRKLRIENYIQALEQAGHTVTYRFAYSKQREEDCATFVTVLQSQRFECHFGNTPWGIPMALRIADIVANVDSVVLGSNVPELGRILAWAKERGKLTKCFAVGVPAFFSQFAECVEVGEEILT